METCFFKKPLLSNGRCIFSYLVAVTQQRIYVPQHIGFASDRNGAFEYIVPMFLYYILICMT
jgi:hypothetical protein